MGNDDRVLLAAIRSLGRYGLQVHAGWCHPELPALTSRYLHRFHNLREYAEHDSTWIDELNRLVRKTRFDLVIPCNDYAVLPLQLARRRLDSPTRYALLDDAVYGCVSDKEQTIDLARRIGIPTPQQWCWPRGEPRSECADPVLDRAMVNRLRFPLFIKPRSSVTRSDTGQKRAVVQVDRREDWDAALSQIGGRDDLLVQEGFAGVGQGVEVLAQRGRILVEMQHRRLRETIDGGSTLREVIRPDPRLSHATAAMMKALNFTGVAMTEFRRDPDSSRFVLLEINARFWGSLPLAVAAGRDFPVYLYQMLVEGRTRFELPPPRAIRCCNLIPDLRHIKRERGALAAIGSLLAGPFRGEYQDHWARDDWRPQAALLQNLGSSLVRKVLRFGSR